MNGQSLEHLHGLYRAVMVIIVSEIGDKTFLVAAILSMRHPRRTVFLGAIFALGIMSLLSALMGTLLPALLPKKYTTICAALLFFVFGARMIQEGLEMEDGEAGRERMQKEMEEVEHEIQENEDGTSGGFKMNNLGKDTDGEQAIPLPATHKRRDLNLVQQAQDGLKNLSSLLFSPIFIQAFLLTFLAEWGDRSQITTIALGAAHNVWIVTLGTTFGHGLCSGLAVIAGRWVSTRVSIKHVTMGGAVLFILFGFLYSYEAYMLDSSTTLAPTSDALPAQ